MVVIAFSNQVKNNVARLDRITNKANNAFLCAGLVVTWSSRSMISSKQTLLLATRHQPTESCRANRPTRLDWFTSCRNSYKALFRTGKGCASHFPSLDKQMTYDLNASTHNNLNTCNLKACSGYQVMAVFAAVPPFLPMSLLQQRTATGNVTFEACADVFPVPKVMSRWDVLT